MLKPEEFYRNKFEVYSFELTKLSRFLKRFTWYRLLTFLGIFLPVSLLGLQWLTLPLTLILAIIFFALVKKNIQLEKKKQRLSILKKIVEDEQLALSHSFLHFQDGKEFLDTEHFFSYDLDLFGPGSLFQFVNRTSTVGGRQTLAGWFIKPFKDKSDIERRQEAIKELSGNPDWRLQFTAEGSLFEETNELSEEMKNWAKMEMEINRPGLVKLLMWLLPLLTGLAAVPSILGMSSSLLLLIVFIQFLLMYLYWHRINQYFGFFGRKSELLSKYMELLHIIENSAFRSEHLIGLQKKVSDPAASVLFRQLKSLVKEFEYRQNVLVGVALNGLFLWDIRCVFRLWDWHRKNHKHLSVWLNTIAEMDALVSLGNYACNHREFVYPEVQQHDFLFKAEELGHPLLEAGKRICNDVEIKGWSKVMIVTGANMAGKSTFLRTVGVNLILARLGAPVCANEFVFTPIEIYTNMRTTDSLLKDESYFFAELKRIKGVLEKLQNGEQIFVILDEMLKGTNSIDKLNGSRELIKKLVEFQSVSLIATHDLKLSEMEKDYPQRVSNKCFEIQIEDDELVFDYKLSDGATKTMNATFLMKKMGII